MFFIKTIILDRNNVYITQFYEKKPNRLYTFNAHPRMSAEEVKVFTAESPAKQGSLPRRRLAENDAFALT